MVLFDIKSLRCVAFAATTVLYTAHLPSSKAVHLSTARLNWLLCGSGAVAVVLDDFGYPKTYITGVRQLQWQHPVANVQREKNGRRVENDLLPLFFTGNSKSQHKYKRWNENITIFFCCVLADSQFSTFHDKRETACSIVRTLPVWKKM